MASASKAEDPDVNIPSFNAVIPNTHRSTADIYSKEIYFLVLYPQQLSLSDKQSIELVNLRLGYADVSTGPVVGYKLQDILTANGFRVIPATP